MELHGILGTHVKGKISRYIYGHFAEHLGRCIYDGVWVGETSSIPNIEGLRKDVIDALKEIKIPVIRWPGGCFADEYHWRNGIGPRAQRPKTVNTHWGGVVENNHFGTHEFFRLCELTGAEPYICGNVGSGTPQEMTEWLEYIKYAGESSLANVRRENGREEPFPLTFFGIGNENWGCGGAMRAEYYADLYRRFHVYCRDFGEKPLYRIACGANVDDYEWTRTLMKNVRNMQQQCAPQWMNGLSLHHYSIYQKKQGSNGSAIDFDVDEYYGTLAAAMKMKKLLRVHCAIMEQYDPCKNVGLIVDEWGTWYDVEPGTHPGFLFQQNTMRDALVAALTLNIFNHYCDRVYMANIAQMVNVLQSVVLTEGETLIKTPTFHVFRMFAKHQDAELCDLHIEEKIIEDSHAIGHTALPVISHSASRTKDGTVLITLANVSHDTGATVKIRVPEDSVISSSEELTASDMSAHNTCENPEEVIPRSLAAEITDDILMIPLSAMSVAAIEVR